VISIAKEKKKKKKGGRKKGGRKGGTRRGGGGGGFGRKAKSQIKSIVSGFNLLEDALFFAAGWFTKPALEQTGLTWLLYDHVKPYHDYVDSSANRGLSGAKNGGAGLITKTGGFAGLAKVLYDGTNGTLSSKDKNVLLPYSLGLMMDPEGADEGMYNVGSTRGNW